MRNNSKKFKSKSVSSWNLESNIRKKCKTKKLFRYRKTREQSQHGSASNLERRILTVAIFLRILQQQKKVKRAVQP